VRLSRDYKVALKREGIDPRVKKRATAQGSKTFKEFAEEQYPVWCQGLWGCPHHGVGEGRGTPAVQILCVNARQGPASGPVHWWFVMIRFEEDKRGLLLEYDVVYPLRSAQYQFCNYGVF
jgi:hypothetical protein